MFPQVNTNSDPLVVIKTKMCLRNILVVYRNEMYRQNKNYILQVYIFGVHGIRLAVLHIEVIRFHPC